MYPNKSKILVEAFREAMSIPYGNLLVDMRTDLDEQFRLRTGIFPGDIQYVYAQIKQSVERNFSQSLKMSSSSTEARCSAENNAGCNT